MSIQLSDKESEIYQKAYEDLQDFMKEVEQSASSLSVAKSHNPLINKIYDLSFNYQKSLKELDENQEQSGLKNTHKKITEIALNAVNFRISHDIKDFLIETSAGPDKHLKTILLFMEGHFYGKTESDSYGNFIPIYFGDFITGFLDQMNDVDETALSNLAHYYMKYKNENNLEAFGWSLHYIQDLTAPPHAGNLPVFLPKLKKDVADTHHPFEKLARERINNDPDFFAAKSANPYKELKPIFIGDLAGLNNFGKKLYEMTSPYIKNVRHHDELKWNEAIDETLPLAIAATTVILESSLQ